MNGQKMTVRVKKLRANAKLPSYGTEFSAGADLYACTDAPVCIAPGQSLAVPTGISVELPPCTVGLIYARSGLACKKGLAPANKVGVIDSDYRGEIVVVLFNHSGQERVVEPGERVAQMVVTPYIPAVFEEADDLSLTVRGEAGFGSTGRK